MRFKKKRMKRRSYLMKYFYRIGVVCSLVELSDKTVLFLFRCQQPTIMVSIYLKLRPCKVFSWFFSVFAFHVFVWYAYRTYCSTMCHKLLIINPSYVPQKLSKTHVRISMYLYHHDAWDNQWKNQFSGKLK